MGWLKDNVDALEKRRLISSNEELEIMKDFSEALSKEIPRGVKFTPIHVPTTEYSPESEADGDSMTTLNSLAQLVCKDKK